MARKKKEIMELRFYEVPQGETVLALLGDKWNRVYGHEELHLHFHNLMEVGVCRRGAGRLLFEEEEHRYADGLISVIPENCPHTTISDGEKPNAWEYLFFDPKEIVEELFPDNAIYRGEVLDKINKLPRLLEAKEHASLARIVDAIMEEAGEKRTYYKKAIRQYVHLLIYELIRLSNGLLDYEDPSPRKSNGMQIAAALEYINRQYAQQLKVKDLADACGMSETHFRRIFEEYVNMSPMDYLNLVRIQRACELMKKNNDSMDVIAAKCGFTTTSTFNRNFKKYLETSPYQWKINPDNYERKIRGYHITALKGW